MSQDIEARLDRLFQAFRQWSIAWGVSRLPRDATVEFDDRIESALGLCEVRAGRIVLNAVLLRPENEGLLHETLCHEAAHLVVYLRYGSGVEEHGEEWRATLRRAGFRPRAVIPESEVGRGERSRRGRPGRIGASRGPGASGTVRPP